MSFFIMSTLSNYHQYLKMYHITNICSSQYRNITVYRQICDFLSTNWRVAIQYEYDLPPKSWCNYNVLILISCVIDSDCHLLCVSVKSLGFRTKKLPDVRDQRATLRAMQPHRAERVMGIEPM